MTPSPRSKSVQRYGEDHPDMAPTLAFFEKLWSLQDSIAEEAPDWEPPAADEVETALKSHRILFAISAPPVPAEAFRRALRSVADLLAEEGGLPLEQADALKAADFENVVTDDMAADILKGVDAFVSAMYEKLDSDDAGAPLSTFSFIVTTALTPFIVAGATKALKPLKPFDWTRWDSGLCPVCGTPASSGRVIDGGELKGSIRMLSCPLCRAEWGFTRLRCARCGERSQGKLEYLFDEQDPGHRIHTCKICHGYLKTSFEKDLGFSVDPTVEEVVMLALDAVATQRGLTPLGDDDTPAAN
ncbi:MAG: formate dehydrogenase accessory protein FdhE [Coriobacteriia bacterium]|nr:formate dehydrogenase accessory protein FdhE [Coriobacteriia bacterium]